MKLKIGFLSMMMLAGVLMANAQGGQGGMRRTPEERTKRVVDTLTTLFKLDQNQQTQSTAAFMDYNKAMDKLREGMQGGGARPDRAEIEKLTTERDEKLKKALGEDQFKKYKDEIEPAMRMRRQGGGGNN
jgi:hypothetical protein